MIFILFSRHATDNNETHVTNIKLIILNRFSPHNIFSQQTRIYNMCVIYLSILQTSCTRATHIRTSFQPLVAFRLSDYPLGNIIQNERWHI